MYLLKSDVFMCPALGGDAVYKARSIFALFNDSIQYNDELACFNAGVQFRKANTEEKININPIKISPNPTKDYLTIVGLEESSEVFFIEIVNMIGEIFIPMTKYSNCDNINVQNLASGVYGVKLYTNTRLFLLNDKFIKL